MHSGRLQQAPAQRNPGQIKEAVQEELLDIFMDLQTREDRHRDKAANQRRLDARRAIEQYRERKALEDAIRDGWDDL
ncbi:MAG: hypothetical protein R3296_02015 [Oleiphilaceae bacterium]|nr:hypothetical protein [Oleiphilaceae bacterium]